MYLAPEFDTPYADPVDLDVFGLGAVSYLILTGRPPAAQRSDLIERLTAEGGLHPCAVLDGIADRLDGLIFQATRTDVAVRLDSAARFLDHLDLVEQDSPAPEPTAAQVDPLTAQPGQLVDGQWCVQRVLGTGATARALPLVAHRKLVVRVSCHGIRAILPAVSCPISWSRCASARRTTFAMSSWPSSSRTCRSTPTSSN